MWHLLHLQLFFPNMLIYEVLIKIESNRTSMKASLCEEVYG